MTRTIETPQLEQPQDAGDARAMETPIGWSPTAVTAMQSDPTLSYWIKRAIGDLAQRDPLDALHDAELLRALMKARWQAHAGITSKTDGA